MTIGERIKLRRLELGFSVDHLADLLGKNRATVYRYENNSIENLPATILEPLAKALQTTPGQLMGFDEANTLSSTKQASIDIECRKRMKYLREDLLQMNVDDFAKNFNVSSEWYEKIENGEETLPISILSRISTEYNVNYNWLLFEQGNVFVKASANRIEEISQEYGLDEDSEFILESFLNFDSDKRKNLSSLILEMLSKQQERKSNLEVIEPSVEIVRAARSSNDKNIEKKTLTNKDYKELVNKLETAPKVTELK